jgi:uncharacterized Tic20 family protein
MIYKNTFTYLPKEHEAEAASNSYLMSLLFIMAGLPLPIVNLIGTIIFFFTNRKSTYFVRWHCTQNLLSQLAMFLINSVGFWWTISILFTNESISNKYIAYIMMLLIFNITEMITTIYAAIQTRKGYHIQWWFFSSLTNLICKADKS